VFETQDDSYENDKEEDTTEDTDINDILESESVLDGDSEITTDRYGSADDGYSTEELQNLESDIEHDEEDENKEQQESVESDEMIDNQTEMESEVAEEILSEQKIEENAEIEKQQDIFWVEEKKELATDSNIIRKKYLISYYINLSDAFGDLKEEDIEIDGMPDNAEVLETSVFAIPDTIPMIGGYEFLGWNTMDDGSGIMYSPDDSITVTENVNLYAQWDFILETLDGVPAAKPLPTLTGDQRADAVAIAKSQIGYKEGSGHQNIYGQEMNANGVSWCVYFADWVVKKAGVNDRPTTGSTMAAVTWFKDRNQWSLSNYTPQPGDYVFIENDEKPQNGPDHTAFIIDVDATWIYTAEGNVGSSRDPNGLSGVASYKYSRNTLQSTWSTSTYIAGFGSLQYASGKSFSFWGDLVNTDNISVSGTYKFWWKQTGYEGCDVNVRLDDDFGLGTIYPDSNGLFSFEFDTTKHAEGAHTVWAVLRDRSGAEVWLSKHISIVNDIRGYADIIEGGNGTLKVKGWAFDNDSWGSDITIQLVVGDNETYDIVANKSRPDVEGTYPKVGTNHGFDENIFVKSRGSCDVKVYGIDVNNPSRKVLLNMGRKTVTIRNIGSSNITFLKEHIDLKVGESTVQSFTFAGDGIYSLGVRYSDETIVYDISKYADWAKGTCNLPLTAGQADVPFYIHIYLRDAKGNAIYEKSFTAHFTEPEVKITSISLNKGCLELKKGNMENLTVTVAPSNATNKSIKWTSSDNSIVSVSGGTITAKVAGTATITATAADGSGKTATCSVTVTQPVTGISLNRSSLTLEKGAAEKLIVTISPSDASNKNVTWSSSNTSVATVSGGTVTAKAAGMATITVRASDGSGKTASCSVTVTQPVDGINLNKSEMTLVNGATEKLTATISPSNASNKNISWSSSNTNIATVTNGTVTAKSIGTAIITVTTVNKGKTASCKVTVVPKEYPVNGVALDQSTQTITEGESFKLIATVFPENATNKSDDWESSNTDVVMVDQEGNVSALETGTATIKVTTKDGKKTAICNVTVVERDLPFTDVSKSSWYYKYVKYVYNNGLMGGISETLFAPDRPVTRGMGVQVLYNYAGQPVADTPDFLDVKSTDWFAKAVGWASAEGIVSGYPGNKFGPNDNLNREQLLLILYNYSENNGMNMSAKVDVSNYTDVAKVDNWAYTAVKWGIANGIIGGKPDGSSSKMKIDPLGVATRAEFATIMRNYIEEYLKSSDKK
ncbi:Ig-like domain-containing protein, partial [Butyrivibrio sp.]|uniref:Ig-like domain-containing protein n=1 Tax=Butyrivibrio sp. TaxID=28121 RepID=UPI0025C0D13C